MRYTYIHLRYFFVLFLLLVCNSGYSQFNTITRKQSLKSITEQSSPELPEAKESIQKDISQPVSAAVLSNDTVDVLNLFSLPIKEIVVTSEYGYRQDPFTKKRKFHYGLDLSTKSEKVFAIMPGRITKVGYEKKGLGNYVVIEHGDFTTTYGHLHTSIGTKGDYVKAGEEIGISGSTGRSTGEHLHLGIKFKGKHTDPLPIIQFIKEKHNTSSKSAIVQYASIKKEGEL